MNTIPIDNQWINTGYGRINWDDGASYIGYLVDGKAHNSGVFVYPDGSIFNGQFKMG
jgi:hypothetical protein